MALCKIKEEYHPSEGWRVGEIVDITNPAELLRQGLVRLVDKQGAEIDVPFGDIASQIASGDVQGAYSMVQKAVNEKMEQIEAARIRKLKEQENALLRAAEVEKQLMQARANLATEKATNAMKARALPGTKTAQISTETKRGRPKKNG